MKVLLAPTLLLASVTAAAHAAPKGDSATGSGVTIHATQPGTDLDAFGKQHRKVAIDDPSFMPPSRLPTLADRERLFKESGLARETVAMDELDRDLLFQRARAMPKRDLARRYPALPSAKLTRLQELIKRHDTQKKKR